MCDEVRRFDSLDAFAEAADAAVKPKPFGFGTALAAIKAGKRVARAGWNGKGMYVYLYKEPGLEPCISMFTAQAKHQPGWLASQADMLAEDWEVVES